ncbi:hypothetical protein [Mesorhizobium sp. LSHC412B00]|uniref:hypothetical protein n=1 Tax=Mesorhizobium sp. LSHC412B00 TaxID=1287285 RepID=UPI0035933DDA
MKLLDRPVSIPVLQQNQLIREMHYWLLIGRHGAGIHALGNHRQPCKPHRAGRRAYHPRGMFETALARARSRPRSRA